MTGSLTAIQSLKDCVTYNMSLTLMTTFNSQTSTNKKLNTFKALLKKVLTLFPTSD